MSASDPSIRPPERPGSRVSPPTAAVGDAAAAGDNSEAVAAQRLDELLAEITEVASALPEATLVAAANRLGMLAAAARARSGGDGGSPLQPAALNFAEVAHIRTLGELCSECDDDGAGSMASLEHAGAAGGDERAEQEAQQQQQSWDDEQLYVGGPLRDAWLHDEWDEEQGILERGTDFDDGRSDVGQTEDGVGAREDRMPRMADSRERDPLGLAQHGRRMYCDYHDLHGGCPNACMAVDMLQQWRIAALVEERQRLRQRKPRDDPDGRQARHALYKAGIAWQWANPLGAEQRVRFPACVMYRVRRLFPHPRCGEGCDYLDECEANGHYTGFRTATESRAIREGAFLRADTE